MKLSKSKILVFTLLSAFLFFDIYSTMLYKFESTKIRKSKSNSKFSTTFKNRIALKCRNKLAKENSKYEMNNHSNSKALSLEQVMYATLRVALDYSYTFNADEVVKETGDKDEFTNTIEVVNSSSKAIIIYIKNSKALIISYRGSTNFGNFIKDGNIKKTPLALGGNAHKGFSDYYNDLKDDVDKAVEQYLKSVDHLVFTGHSLGAAAATIDAYFRIPKLKTTYKDMKFYLITYGSPRVGDKDFSTTVNKLPLQVNLRIVNNKDIVTTMPGEGFEHVGTELIYKYKNSPKYEFKDYNQDKSVKLLDNYESFMNFAVKSACKAPSAIGNLISSVWNEGFSETMKCTTENLTTAFYTKVNDVKDHLTYCIAESEFLKILTDYNALKAKNGGKKFRKSKHNVQKSHKKNKILKPKKH